MKKAAYGFIGLLVLLVAALLIGPSFVDWNAHKERLAAELREATGRELIIDGDMSLALLPRPALSAAEVSIANIEGGSAPTMVELRELRVRVAPMALFQGRIQVESVQLVEPRILLEVLADGRRNWQLETAAEGAAGTSGQSAAKSPSLGSGLAGQIRIDDFTITGGTLVYRNAGSQLEERVEGIDAVVVAESLNGPATARGNALLRGVDSSFEIALGALLRGGATPFSMSLGSAEAEADLKFAGSVSVHPTAVRYRGHLSAQGKDLAVALRTLVPDGPAPATALGHGFAFDIDLEGDLAGVTGRDLRLSLGDNTLTGEAAVTLGPPLDATLTLGATRFDLDKMLAGGAERAPDPAAAVPSLARRASVPAGLDALAALSALPADATAHLSIAIEGLIYRQQAIRQLRLDAALRDGQVTVAEARAKLPGSSNLALTGGLTPGGERPRLDARLEFKSSNLRGLAAWLGADLAGVPPERLRRLELNGVVEGDAKQLSLKDIDLKVDLAQINGGIVVALRERLGLGVGLAVDHLNLDAYLPQEGVGLPGTPPQEAPDQAENDDAPRDEEDGAAPALPEHLAELLDSLDANLDIRFGKLTLGGTAARSLRLTATLQNGAATFKEVSVGDLAGARADFAGLVSELAGEPAVDGTLSLEVPDPLRFAKATGLDRETLARLGPFSMTANLRGGRRTLNLETEVDARDGAFSLSGTLEPGARPIAFDLAVGARHPALARLAAAWDLPLGAGLGDLEVTGRIAGTPLALKISDLLGYVGPLDLSGSFEVDLSGPAPKFGGIDVGFELEHNDLAGLAEALAGPLTIDRDLGAIRLAGRLTGGGDRAQLVDLAGTLGPVELSGAIDADLAGARPNLKARIDAGEVPFAALLAPLAGGGKRGSTGPGWARWSQKPFNTTGMRALDGELALTARSLVMDGFTLKDARLKAGLADGRLALDMLSGRLHGGALEVSGEIAAGDGLAFDLVFDADDLELGSLLQDQAGFDWLTGPLHLETRLTATGTTEAELIASLAGQGGLDAQLAVDAPAGGSAVTLSGGQSVAIRGIGDATAMLLEAFAEAPATLSGKFRVAEGVIAGEDLRLQGETVHALTSGELHLPSWRLQSRSEVFTDEGGAEPYLTLDLTGPADGPDVRVTSKPSEPEEDAPEPEPVPQLAPSEAPAAPAVPAAREVTEPAPVAQGVAEPAPSGEAEAEPAPASTPDAPEPAPVAEQPAPDPVEQAVDPAEPVEVEEEEPVVEASPEAAPIAAPDPAPEPVEQAVKPVEVEEEPAAEQEPPVEPELAVEPEPVVEEEPVAEQELAVEPEPGPDPQAVEQAARPAVPDEQAADPTAADPTAADPVTGSDAGLPPLPKRKPAFLQVPGDGAPAAETEAEAPPAKPEGDGFIDRILSDLTAPKKPGTELTPKSEETSDEGFVGNILKKLKQ